ncbi:MAG: low molecular weight protein-tyrosine-phosphatase [Bacteroidales bacterium]
MKKILMVCMGNICRSPMAQGLMEEKIKKYGINASVDSAGTIDYHEGEPPDIRAQAIMKTHGIDISHQRARQIRPEDLEKFDYIFVMDSSNMRELLRINTPEQKDKIRYVTAFAWPGEDLEVPDPYYGGREGFENTYKVLDEACEAIARHILKEAR